MPVYDSLLRSKQACASLGCAKEARVLLDGTSGGTSVDPGAGPGYGAAAAGWAAGAAAVPGLVLPVHPSARIVTLPRTMIPALRHIRRLPAILPPSRRWSGPTLARCDAMVHFGGVRWGLCSASSGPSRSQYNSRGKVHDRFKHPRQVPLAD